MDTGKGEATSLKKTLSRKEMEFDQQMFIAMNLPGTLLGTGVQQVTKQTKSLSQRSGLEEGTGIKQTVK